MEYIDHSDLTSRILVTVDQEKLNGYYSNIRIDRYDEENNKLDFKNHPTTVDIGLKTRDKLKFNKVFDALLKPTGNAAKTLTNDQLEQQKAELIYFLPYLKSTDIHGFSSTRVRNDRVFLLELIKMLEAVKQVSPTDQLRISVIKKNGKARNIIYLPLANDTQNFYKFISDTVFQYVRKNPGSLARELYLNAYKEPITPNLLRRRYEELYVKGNDTVISDKILLSASVHILLPYLNSLPQFRQSTKVKSTFTNTQARFFLSFFQLFGFNDHEFKLNLSGLPNMTVEQLRKQYEAFSKKYI